MGLFSKLRLKRASGKEPGPVSPDAWNGVISAIEELERRINAIYPVNSSDIGVRGVGGNGVKFFLKRRNIGSKAYVPPCQFGRLTSLDGSTAIAGGFVTCGDQNWTIPDKELPELDGTYDAYLEIDVVANMDDDNALLLPGIATGTEPTSGIQFVESGSLPSNSAPTPPSGAGTVILPIATIEMYGGSVASFSPGGCGPFIVEHCGGSLSYSRPGE